MNMQNNFTGLNKNCLILSQENIPGIHKTYMNSLFYGIIDLHHLDRYLGSNVTNNPKSKVQEDLKVMQTTIEYKLQTNFF